eukprot:1775867-Rhodomonas_salina.1
MAAMTYKLLGTRVLLDPYPGCLSPDWYPGTPRQLDQKMEVSVWQRRRKSWEIKGNESSL